MIREQFFNKNNFPQTHRQSYSKLNSQDGWIYLIEVLLIPTPADIWLILSFNFISKKRQKHKSRMDFKTITAKDNTRNDHLILLQLHILI